MIDKRLTSINKKIHLIYDNFLITIQLLGLINNWLSDAELCNFLYKPAGQSVLTSSNETLLVVMPLCFEFFPISFIFLLYFYEIF